MYTLISFATQWGSKYGGINSFNTDFLSALGVAYHLGIQVVCVVTSATNEEIEQARNTYVTLVPLPYSPADKQLSTTHAQTALDELKRRDIGFDPGRTVWLGHDRISGAAAIAAAQQAGGRSALIHHMSYDHYESYAEDSATARTKVEEQTTLFKQADIVLAIGPLLRDALSDMIEATKPVCMLIPGLAEISLREPPKKFTAFLSGRLSEDAARIKQGYLGIAAFALAHREACDKSMPDGLCKEPKLVLRGVDLEAPLLQDNQINPETELKQFAEKYAQRVINLHTLPFTQDRQTLYADLSGSSVAMMPSWHEGFGLAAWEAIAAGVPLIISENSGVFRLLDELNLDNEVYSISVRASSNDPYFREEDLPAVVAKLTEIAHKPDKARSIAGRLRNNLAKFSWPHCAEQATQAFGWTVQKGSLPPVTPEQIAAVLSAPAPPPQSPATIFSPLQIPARQWKAGSGLADSQLLRAEEALVPFDPARQPDLDALNAWLDDREWPNAVRLITGAGGLGKTRLALELCQQRAANGWHTGFLDALLEPREMKQAWEQLHAFDMPVLAVIDYAETRQPVLLALVKAILQQPGKHPIRILLLARDGGEWWDNLPSKDPHCEALLSGYATTGPYTLLPLHPEEEGRRHAYRQALSAFADALGVRVPEVTPELSGEHFGRPLYLQMAALLALHGERPTTAEGLTRALLNHERRYWSRLLANFIFSEPEQHAQQLLALTTLAGGFATPRDAQVYWNKSDANKLSPAEFTSLFKALVPLYPGKQGLQAVRPDLLGEALVAQTLAGSEATRLLDAVLSNGSTQGIRLHTLTVLARLLDKYPDLHETAAEALARNFAHCNQEVLTVAIETAGDFAVVAETAFARLDPLAKSQVAGLLEPQLRQDSVQLAVLGCLVKEYLVEKARQKLDKKQNLDNHAHYARKMMNYSISLRRVGRNDQALYCAKEAYKLFKSLHSLDSERFAYSYSTSLNFYSNRLGDAGQLEAALVHANHALEIRKWLAQKESDNYKPAYAMSLNDYANHLSYSGQNETALMFARQSLEINKQLAQNNPDRYESDYAISLNTFANRLSDVGQNQDALEFMYNALEINKRLVQKTPDRYEPDYASSLNNYAVCLCSVGIYEDALNYAKQSSNIRKRLAQKNPMRFTEEMLSSNCLAGFICWLLNDLNDYYGLANIHNNIQPTIFSYRWQLMQLFIAFVQACYSMTLEQRDSSMKQIITVWDELSQASRKKAQPYWLCAVAWCATYSPETVADLAWQTDWQKFAQQRQGRIPHWMPEVARRLEFQWPDWTEQSDEPIIPVAGQP
ncbi:Glycosyltransferase involved in cell wall bisynthesis [Trichlorobacter thiogenes]|uniref:Glycosyltransferase involved in cell wall bisynthesis n=1 Tax=Trichlorobacter thiogenes TaxID=115783 RepID=A0A1T4LQV7_9BACT|nr:tetratricopeptide repeat protein [Trichlorobacter thiogenes]SJZ57139.1 Glycosyltransferase involved in cell wall bisynthesis [Trichlorobacter thiogenes]